jgi:hypothetical protein
MKQTVKTLLSIAGLQTSKNGHLCTYTICPKSNEIVFFYVGILDTTNGTQKENCFIAFYGLPDGSTAPSNNELENALSKWLKHNTAKPHDISMVFSHMSEEMEINKRLSAGETINEIINSQKQK